MNSPEHRSQGRPFLAAPRPAFYFPARVVDSAREELERGIRRAEGAGLVVGQAGTGKSLLLAKLAEDLRDDFDVALLSGARICTRRALWQSMLAEIGEAYRGLEENDLRMSVVERVRGLAATCSGLVVLVDEAQTLPMRLMEELRLLSTVPTPLPAVHIVLAGTRELEERLANPKLESLAQRIVVRTYLEPLDHAETCGYVRSQCRQAGIAWEDHFEAGCDDAVFSITDGVPRLINQICDHALVAAGEQARLRPAHIDAAWREIQRLPSPESLAFGEPAASESDAALQPEQESSTISFGALDGDDWADGWWNDSPAPESDPSPAIRTDGPHRIANVGESVAKSAETSPAVSVPADVDPFQGPDVEFFFDASRDPFDALFEEEVGGQRHAVDMPDDFRGCRQVASPEGGGFARDLAAFEGTVDEGSVAGREPRGDEIERSPWEPDEQRSWQDQYEYRSDHKADACGDLESELESVDEPISGCDDDSEDLDADVIVVEEDLVEDPADAERSVFAVRPADYRQLFARLRRR